MLIQRPERKIALCATGFFVIKTIQPHIRFLNFLRAVVKRIEGVHFGRNGYFHFGRENRVVGALDALRGYFKFSATFRTTLTKKLRKLFIFEMFNPQNSPLCPEYLK